jgi:hypothetical protein
MGGQVRAVTFYYYHARAPKIGRAAQPQQPCCNIGSTRALRCSLGEGARKQSGGINTIGGWVMREAMHAREMVFFGIVRALTYEF